MNTGDIIKATASRNWFLNHRAIVVVECGKIYLSHNTPMYQNNFGGNVIVQSMDDFLNDGRKILKVEKSHLSYEDIYCYNERVRFKKFNLMNFNCEQYVFNCLGTPRSPQKESWMIAAFGLLILG